MFGGVGARVRRSGWSLGVLALNGCYFISDDALNARLGARPDDTSETETGNPDDTDTAQVDTGDADTDSDSDTDTDADSDSDTDADSDTDSDADSDSDSDTDTACGDWDADGYTDASCGGDDCDDYDILVNPGASESCNSRDDDCDGDTDEDPVDGSNYYQDFDADGHGGSAVRIDACSLPAGYSAVSDDCDDGDSAIYPGATEVCNDVDDDCDGSIDGDFTVPATYARIQDAIDATVDGDMVCVSAGTYKETIDFGSHDITLWGAGSATTTIDADGKGRAVLMYDTSIRPTLRGFTITGGEASSGNGAGMYVRCAGATLDDLVLTGNSCTTTASCVGTGLIVYADVEITDVTVSGNTTQPDGSSGSDLAVYGGGAYFWGVTGDVTGLTVEDNTVDLSKGEASADVYGGGLQIQASNATFTDVVVSGNTTTGTGPINTGFYAAGAGLNLLEDASTFEHLTIDENFVQLSGVSDEVEGGGLYVEDSSTSMQWVDVRDNYAASGASFGGGIFIYDSSTLTLTNAILAGNETVATTSYALGTIMIDGYNVLTVENADIYSNAVSGVTAAGGGIYVGGAGEVSLVNTSIVGNGVVGTVGTYGGAMYYVAATGSYPNATYSNFYDNSAPEFTGITSSVGKDGNIELDPIYSDVSSSNPVDWDMSLDVTSPLRDAGSPSIFDADGGASDIGAYGGLGSASW